MDELSRRNLVTVAAITMASTVAFAGASLMSSFVAVIQPMLAIPEDRGSGSASR